MADQKAITKRSEDQARWYTDVVQRAQLADYSPVRGCMVIRPYGYAIWERIQADLNARIKDAGVENAYFPLFIPYKFLEKEADHIEGFAPEVAVVTHAGGEELEEKLVVRPTSETMIYHMFAQWIQSYRDLPLKINQWANIVRWEKRTTPFLRTTEFLWQEGHTIHADRKEAEQEVRRALDMYHDFAAETMAMYTIKGYKTEAEKFAGAEFTTTIEALMKDGKALQSGTSHLLSQNFAKSFDVKFLDENGEQKYVWPTSWGLSTRVIGGLILMHGDDKGLVLPPNIAPVQVRIIPIYKKENAEGVIDYAQEIKKILTNAGVRTDIDLTENTPGWKFAQSEMTGTPIRLEIGGRELESQQVVAVERLTSTKQDIAMSDLVEQVKKILNELQAKIFEQGKQFTMDNIKDAGSEEEFMELAKSEFGYIRAYFSGDKATEARIKEQTRYTTRCVPFETFEQEGKCIFTGQPGHLTLFAKAY